MLDNNRWDSTPVDHILMKYLRDTEVEEQLQRTGYLGCINVQVASYSLQANKTTVTTL